MARKIVSPDELFDKFKDHFLKATGGKAPPLACALIATAFLENALISLLGRFFIEGSTTTNLLKPGNALGDLSKLSDMAYCLGFITTPMLQNLKCIGDIRNTFAHSHEFIDFDHPSLKNSISQLTLPRVAPPKLVKEMDTDSRSKFSIIATILYGWITVTAQELERRKRPEERMGEDELW